MQVYDVAPSDLAQDTALWLTLLGLIGLVVYAVLAIKRPAWAPSDASLCVWSAVACAGGSLILAHPGVERLTKALLNTGMVCIWSIGAPVSDVAVVTVFSVAVQGRPQGLWMGAYTM
jgi:hypothetical protein